MHSCVIRLLLGFIEATQVFLQRNQLIFQLCLKSEDKESYLSYCTLNNVNSFLSLQKYHLLQFESSKVTFSKED